MNGLQIVFVVGMLGVGKTTFLTRLIDWLLEGGASFEDLGMLANDAGKINADARRLRARFPRLDVKDITSMCMGCQGKERVRGYLLAAAAAGKKMVLIEPTGNLKPDEVSDLVTYIRGAGGTCHVVSLVSAADFGRQQALGRLTGYLTLADFVGITHIHERGVPPQLMSVVAGASEGAQIGLITEAPVPFELVLGSDTAKSRPAFRWRTQRANGEGVHVPPVHITLDASLSWADVLALLTPYTPQIERLKGVVDGYECDYVGGWTKGSPSDVSPHLDVFLMPGGMLPVSLVKRLGPEETGEVSAADLVAAAEFLMAEAPPVHTEDGIMPVNKDDVLLFHLLSALPAGYDELRRRAISANLLRLAEGAEALRSWVPRDDDATPAAVLMTWKRWVGSLLAARAMIYRDQIDDVVFERCVAVRPVELLIEGWRELPAIGYEAWEDQNPVFLQHVLDFLFAHASEAVRGEAMIEISRLARMVDDAARPAWDELLRQFKR